MEISVNVILESSQAFRHLIKSIASKTFWGDDFLSINRREISYQWGTAELFQAPVAPT